ncbi:hypothetical protein CFC21_037476 [Triticum aestivum]|nr:hypothetical protein CFC21_037476 [Triticum aestivum]VAH67459.1 unnamed protein product [Triticum turgidum subsp. durum]
MEKLVSSAPSHELLVPPPAVSLPIIDLSLGRDEVRRAVLDAGKELGFFQVVNHGVPEHAMWDMEAVCEEFFRLPAPDVAPFYSDDRCKPNRLFSGSTFETGGDKYWTDCLRLTCTFPVGDSKNHWPDKPQGLREVVEKLIVLTRGMGMGWGSATTTSRGPSVVVKPSLALTTTRHAQTWIRDSALGCRHTVTGTSSRSSYPVLSLACRSHTRAIGLPLSPCQMPLSSTSACNLS